MDLALKLCKRQLDKKDFRKKFIAFINEQPDLIRDKIVLNIQAGSGWAGLYCAKMGAKKVYAVEELEATVNIIKGCAVENNLKEQVEVLKGKIKDLTIPEQVDVIVWDWTCQDDGGVMNEIIEAKLYLKQNGIIIPEVCEIYSALTELSNCLGFENVNGVNLNPMANAYRISYIGKPLNGHIDHQSFVSKPFLVTKIKLSEISQDQLNVSKQYSVINVAKIDCIAKGVAIWCSYNISEKQTLLPDDHVDLTDDIEGNTIIFPHEIELDEEEPFCYHLTLFNGEKVFSRIEFENVEPDEIDHPIGCSCYMTKCVVISSCLSNPAFN